MVNGRRPWLSGEPRKRRVSKMAGPAPARARPPQSAGSDRPAPSRSSRARAAVRRGRASVHSGLRSRPCLRRPSARSHRGAARPRPARGGSAETSCRWRRRAAGRRAAPRRGRARDRPSIRAASRCPRTPRSARARAGPRRRPPARSRRTGPRLSRRPVARGSPHRTTRGPAEARAGRTTAGRRGGDRSRRASAPGPTTRCRRRRPARCRRAGGA